MRLSRLVFLFASTVVLGLVMGLVTTASGAWLHIPWQAGLVAGGLLATTSLMGFWAYLALNFVARSTVPRRVWRWAQGLVLVLVLYDMLYFRYRLETLRHPLHHAPYSAFLIQALWPLAVAVVGAAIKRKMSGPGSYLPAVFFLYVFTVADWLLVILLSGPIINQTGIIMMTCNVYLILVFGKLLTKRAPLVLHDAGLNGGLSN